MPVTVSAITAATVLLRDSYREEFILGVLVGLGLPEAGEGQTRVTLKFDCRGYADQGPRQEFIDRFCEAIGGIAVHEPDCTKVLWNKGHTVYVMWKYGEVWC